MSQDKRQHARYDALNLLHFSVPSDQRPQMQGMGRTLNVSHSGILLETHEPIESNQTIMLTIGLEDDLVVIQGETVYCKPASAGCYITGIRFYQMADSPRQVLERYIELFTHG